jgi:ribosomal protein S18 acetylase RimI-like enzyme
LLRLAFQEFEPLYTPEAFLATVQPESGILKRMEEGPVWVAEDAEGIIGTVSAVRAESTMMVRGMAVDPRARGLKIGKALLDLTQTFAQEQGLDRMSLYTTGFLLNAIRLYQSSGFAFTGERVSPHGTELLEMVKILDRGDRRA